MIFPRVKRPVNHGDIAIFNLFYRFLSPKVEIWHIKEFFFFGNCCKPDGIGIFVPVVDLYRFNFYIFSFEGFPHGKGD